MKSYRPLILSALTVLASASLSVAGGGSSGAASLKILSGARGQALGDAYSATADGVESLFWNPAGLVSGSKRSFLLGFQPMLESASMGQGAAAFRTGRWGFGVGFNSLSHDNLDAIDDVGNKTGTFKAQDQSLLLGLAVGGPRCAVGANAKYFRSEIDGVSAGVLAADIGADFADPWSGRLRHALVLRHLGGKLSFVNQADALPMTLTFGNALPVGKRWLADLDLSFDRDQGSSVSGGLEYGIVRSDVVGLNLRGGYTTRRNALDGLSGASFGVGVGVSTLSFDYAWVPFGELGDSHSVTLIWRPTFEGRGMRAEDTAPRGGKQTLKSAKDKMVPSKNGRKQLDQLDPKRRK